MDYRSFFLIATMLALSAILVQTKAEESHQTEIAPVQDEEQLVGRLQTAKRSARVKDNTGRKRRGFVRWEIPAEDYITFSRWQPATTTFGRPYFIPVYGPAGQIPIFFPPQQFQYNVGVPPDNPLKPSFEGPPYLPPGATTKRPTTTTKMTIKDRFPDLDDEDEQRPIWGGSAQTTGPPRRPQPARPQQNGQESSVIPTRPPRPKLTPGVPPLVHQINNSGKIPLNAVEETPENEAAVNKVFGPPPSRPQQSATTVPSRTTTASNRQTTTRRGSPAPSNCVWAVVSCCSATSTKVAEACFEQRGCPGPFWDRSPCESDFAQAAINKALEYYTK